MTQPGIALFTVMHPRPGPPELMDGPVGGLRGLAPLAEPSTGTRYKVRATLAAYAATVAMSAAADQIGETIDDRLWALKWALRLAMARGGRDRVEAVFEVLVVGAGPGPEAVVLRAVLMGAETPGDDFVLLLRLDEE